MGSRRPGTHQDCCSSGHSQRVLHALSRIAASRAVRTPKQGLGEPSRRHGRPITGTRPGRRRSSTRALCCRRCRSAGCSGGPSAAMKPSRANAAFALGEIKDPRAVAPVITITGARTSMVRGGYFFRLYRRLVTQRQPAEGISQRLGRFAVSFEAAGHQETRCRSLGRWQSPRLQSLDCPLCNALALRAR
jgi:hypothetical protein